jgi:UDP-glucuronate 4-epimerase
VNVSGTTSVLQAATDERVEQVFLASTSSVYGQVTRQVMSETDPTDRPLAPYPASKKACEVIAYSFHSAHGINVAIGRFFNAYGPRGRPDMMPWRVLESLVEGRRIPVFGDGSIARDWTYIDDVIDGIVGALAWNPHYEIVNLGRGEPVTLNAFIEHLSELTGCRPLVENVRMPPTEPLRTCADVTKAARMFGYRPTVHLREGLARFREWWEKEATP